VAAGTPVPAPVEVIIGRSQQPGFSTDTVAAASESAGGKSGGGNKTVKKGRGANAVAKAAAEEEEEEEEEGESGMEAHLRTRSREVIWAAI
jgi:hypothetical protein